MTKIQSADLTLDEHANAVVSLLDEYAGDIMGGGATLSEYTRENLIPELRKHSGCHVLLAFIEDKPVGLAIYFEGFSTFSGRKILNIHDFTVSTEYRGRGISKVLPLKIEEIAMDLDCCKLTLEVLEGNILACTIYKKFGFKAYELDPEAGRAMFYEKKLIAT
ncbi:MAG: GNAT family N-acetyltransferase [Pontiella sp.]